MAITKAMHMKASDKGKIDIHLKHAIAYILQPKKLGKANLAGGINCLPDSAYEQMRETKQMFGKTGGRQGYHFVISLKPGEGTPEIMYEIAMQFAEEAFGGEYEAVVAVHTDKPHLHAHIVINSVNMITGYKFQYHNGDWKTHLQPITNRLCEKYGLNITPAEYSKEPKNMERPQWEREQVFSKWIRQDAVFCAINAESMEHFLYLLKKEGFEVRAGQHISVKVPGMKRFKRLDTISEELSRENLEKMFRSQYGENTSFMPEDRTVSLPKARKAVLSPYQNKCYARMYRLQLAEKKRFFYHSAYLYEQIRKMHELQEEYLLITNFDVKSYADLLFLKQRLQRVEDELSDRQKELYRQRAIQRREEKRGSAADIDTTALEDSESEYKEKLEWIKKQKRENRKMMRTLERCLARDGSPADEELERRIPVGDMPEMDDMEHEKVPQNPYREQYSLPKEKAVYMAMSTAEKALCYPLGDVENEKIYEIVKDYFASVGIDTDFATVYEEVKELTEYYEDQRAERFIAEKTEQELHRVEELGLDTDRILKYPADILGRTFDFDGMDYDYAAGVKVFRAVLERMKVDAGLEEMYEVFDRVYGEGMDKVKSEQLHKNK